MNIYYYVGQLQCANNRVWKHYILCIAVLPYPRGSTVYNAGSNTAKTLGVCAYFYSMDFTNSWL
jgi:hypothetical protein